jgi:hypothetical protein
MFLYSIMSRRALGLTQPPVQCVQGPLSPEGKADNSYPSNVQVKKCGAIPPRLHGVVLN